MQRPRRPWLSLLVLCLGTFAILLDTTIVNVALPSLITQRMGAAFGVFSSAAGVAAVTGPVLGGVLTAYLSPRPALTRPPGRRLGPFRLPQPTDNRKGSPL